MLLPIELFHVCVRIRIDISDVRRDRYGTGSGRAPGRRSRVPSRFPRAPRVRRAPAWRLADRSSWLWVLGLRVSRGLCVQRRSRPGRVMRRV